MGTWIGSLRGFGTWLGRFGKLACGGLGIWLARVWEPGLQGFWISVRLIHVTYVSVLRRGSCHFGNFASWPATECPKMKSGAPILEPKNALSLVLPFGRGLARFQVHQVHIQKESFKKLGLGWCNCKVAILFASAARMWRSSS